MPAKKHASSKQITAQKVLLRPQIPDGSHPVESPALDYAIPTPAIYELSEVVHHWLDLKCTGAMLFGSQRFGKTTGVEYVVDELIEESSEHFDTYFIPQIRRAKPNEAAFWGHWLKSVGHALHRGRDPDLKRERLFDFLLEKAQKTAQRRIVIFVDEAQKLGWLHFEWIVDLHNALKRKRVSLVIFLVGQPELLGIRTAFETGGKMEIVGRYMTQDFEFRGLLNHDDVRICLEGYDDYTEHPPESDCSFSRYYFPEAFDLGWRLAQEASKLWDAFAIVRHRHDVTVKDEIPMEYFAHTVELLLKKHSNLTADFIGFSDEQCLKAVEETGYEEGSRYIILPVSLEEEDE